MGLSIKDIIPKKQIEIAELNGKTLCVDAFNAIYQFLSTVRQADGTPLMDNKKRITSHLSGIFYRNINLLEEGLKLIYVFDGKPPELKWKTHKERKDAKDEAKEKYEEAKAKEDISAMRRYSSSMISINEEIIEESKALLKAMGIQVIQAPSEGEAEASYLVKHNSDIYSVASQDYDSLLFGATRLVQNLTLSRKRKTMSGYIEVKPELIELDEVMRHLEIGLDQLICLGILVGTDYNPKGIPGIGQKKALDIVRKYKQPVLIFDSVKEQMMGLPEEQQFDWKEIFELFHKHPVIDSEINFPKLDEAQIKKILVEEHDFSEERVNNALERLRDVREKQKQQGLKKWF